MSALDWEAIGRGAGAAALIVVPAAIVQNLVADTSSLRGLLFLIITAAFGVGGWLAGRVHPERAMTHGGIAALLAYLALLAASIVVRLARGAELALAGVPLALGIALSSGVVGGYVAYRKADAAKMSS